MTAWNLRPIASALWRNRTGALLVAFQIAIGLAVLVNAVYVVKQRVDKINRPNGMDVENMIVVASAGFAKDFDYDASWREDLATIRGLPGVKAASLISNIPLSGGGSSSGYQAEPGEMNPETVVEANTFSVDEQAERRVPGPHRAGPARCDHADDRGAPRDLESGPAAALGAPTHLFRAPVLPERPQHGDLPRERDDCAARDHRARDLRPCDLQRQHAGAPDRHAPRGRCAAPRYRSTLPGRELDGHDRGSRCGLRRRAGRGLLDLGQVRATAARPLLP